MLPYAGGVANPRVRNRDDQPPRRDPGRARRLLALVSVAAVLASIAVATPAGGDEHPAGSEFRPDVAGSRTTELGLGDATNRQDTVDLPDDRPGVSRWDARVAAFGAPQGAAGDGDADSASVPLAGDPTRLHVKFHEHARARWTRGSIEIRADRAVEQLLAAEDGIVVTPLFARPEAELAADRREGIQISGAPVPDLQAWFLVEAADAAQGRRLTEALEASAAVEMVQPEPMLATTAPVEEERQGYLNPGPSGIDAEWSWRRAAGTGSRVTVAVVDSGFDTEHPDLDRAGAPGVAIPHEPAWDPHHGMQVLGILVADDDGAGIRGIASGAGIRTVNSGTTSGDVANAIDLAAGALVAGDVISVSQGICAVSGCADNVVLPLVYSSSARDALRAAAARGIVTVVSAGNGGASLDGFASRLGADAPDTIVVGGGNPSPGTCPDAQSPARGRVAFSNYGRRVDLQGWGACVRTASTGGTYRWWGFTSAATPIVAGAAALVSSMAEERLGVTLTGPQIRTLLRESGAPQVFAGARAGSIGPLPDVRAAVTGLDRIPANDMWSSARPVPDVPVTLVVDNRWAGVELSEPTLSCASISHSVWYSIRPTRDMNLTIDTRGSDHDTALGLWRATGSGLERRGCNDDLAAGANHSGLSRPLRGGQTYYVQVGGSGAASGRLTVNFTSTTMLDVGCDIDNNGRGDLASGSPFEDVDGVERAGRALVHWGRAKGVPRKVTSVTQEWPGLTGGSETGDLFGSAVACGDFDGDGYDDLAIGSRGEDVDGKKRAGAVRIINGKPRGLSETRVTTLTQATAGLATAVEQGDRFGASLAVGDFNGDGYDDLAIGVPGEALRRIRRAGGVHVLPGGPGGLAPRRASYLNGDSDGLPNDADRRDALGASLASGDFDGDGYDDLAIGVPGEAVRGREASGSALVVSGSAAGVVPGARAMALHQAVRGVAGVPERGDSWGAELASGDVNGDHRDDLVVGIPGEGVRGASNTGAVAVFLSANGGLDPTRSTALHRGLDEIKGTAGAGDRFGTSVVVADVGGDGFAEVIVGAPGAMVRTVPRTGAVHVFPGSIAGADVGSDRLITQAGRARKGGLDAGDHFGHAVLAVDIGGDGRRDLVVGVPDEDAGGVRDSGAMLIIPGGRGGPRLAKSKVITQRAPAAGLNEPADRFGLVLSGR